MPCICWYDPPEGSKRLVKLCCEAIVKELKHLRKEGDPIGLQLEDVKKLLDHLWSPESCDKS